MRFIAALLFTTVLVSSCSKDEPKPEVDTGISQAMRDPLGNIGDIIPLADGGAYIRIGAGEGLYYAKGSRMWRVTIDSTHPLSLSVDTLPGKGDFAISRYTRQKAKRKDSGE